MTTGRMIVLLREIFNAIGDEDLTDDDRDSLMAVVQQWALARGSLSKKPEDPDPS